MKFKNTLEEINNRLDDTKKQIKNLKDRIVEINQSKQKQAKKKKEFKKIKIG